MKRLIRIGEEGEMDCVNTAKVLILLSRGSSGGSGGSVDEVDHTAQSSGRVFECKTCNRQFPSFQALGGHRASHKKPRQMGGLNGQAQSALAKPKVHECSICGLEFAIGQALGGHMRRHRATITEGYTHSRVEEKKSTGKRVLCLDLNLTPSENDGLGLGIGLPMVFCFN